MSGFDSLDDWRDSRELSKKCLELIRIKQKESEQLAIKKAEEAKENKYYSACDRLIKLLNNSIEYDRIKSNAYRVKDDFKDLGNYKDSPEKLQLIEKFLKSYDEYESQYLNKLNLLKKEKEDLESSWFFFKRGYIAQKTTIEEATKSKIIKLLCFVIGALFFIGLAILMFSFIETEPDYSYYYYDSYSQKAENFQWIIWGLLVGICPAFLILRLGKKNVLNDILELFKRKKAMEEAIQKYEEYLKTVPPFVYKG